MDARKKQRRRFSPWIFVSIGISMLVLIFLGLIIYRTYSSERSLISIMILPLIAGVVFENRRLKVPWKTLWYKILGALVGSFLAFLPGKSESNYDFEGHILMWPYWFVFIFVLISTIYHEDKLTEQLTEGITLLQSIAVIYWIVDIGLLSFRNYFAYTVLLIGSVFCILSFIHAFSYFSLSKKARLILSIWSSIVMIIFAIDHIYRVFVFDRLVPYRILNEGLNMLQYFLLGVSLIYIFQNAGMLFGYFPSKDGSNGGSYRKDIQKINTKHLNRYSDKQIKISDSLLILILTSLAFLSNYQFHIMPRHTMIWLVFWLFPFAIWIKQYLINNLPFLAPRV